MKAISLWQPWASAVALGFKQVETRHWKSAYTGPIAIHAAKKWSDDLNHFTRVTLPEYGVVLPTGLPRGAIVEACGIEATKWALRRWLDDEAERVRIADAIALLKQDADALEARALKLNRK